MNLVVDLRRQASRPDLLVRGAMQRSLNCGGAVSLGQNALDVLELNGGVPHPEAH